MARKKEVKEDSTVVKVRDWLNEASDDSVGFLYNLVSDEMEDRKLFDPDTDIHENTFKTFLLKSSNDDLEKFFKLMEFEMKKRKLLEEG